MNNADLIVQILKAAGIRRGFGVPSGNVLPLMDAMRSGGIGFVLTAHEGSAAFAADVSARMTGAPGLCIATLGPGATNLSTGVGCAWLDRSPLIAITCTLNQAQLGRRLQMWIDHHALFKPITKASLRLRPGEIVATLDAGAAARIVRAAGPGASRFARGRGAGASHRDAGAGGRGRAGAAPSAFRWRRRRRVPSRAPANCCALRSGRWPSSARAPCACGIRSHCAPWSSGTVFRSRPR